MFPPDNRVALADPRFEPRAVELDNAAACLMNQTCVLERSQGLGDTFAAHAQHMGDQFVRDRQLRRVQPVQA